MRFRAVITDSQQIQCFIKVLQSFAKFSETFLFRLSQNEIQLLNDLTHTSTAFVVKSFLKYEEYFENQEFHGIDSENNQIFFRLRSDSLSHVLTSLLPHIKSLKLQLKKASVGSVLSVAVEYPTNSDSDRCVRHQIKIDFIRSDEWNDICGQDLHTFDVSLHMPDPRLITGTTERLSDFCHYIDIKVKRIDTIKAILSISVESDSVSVKSKFNDLDLNTSEDIDSQTNISEDLMGVRIDVRKMNLLFNTLKHLRPTSIITNISHKNKICFQFIHNFVTFQAFLPNIDLK